MAKTAQDQLGVDLPADDEYDEAQPPAAEPAEAPPEAPSRPDWLPQNFKDPEALVKSYNELGGKMRDEAEQRKQLEQRLAELEQAQQPRGQQDAVEARDYWDNLFEQDPVEAMAQMARAEGARQLQEFQQQQFATQQPSQNAQYELIANGASQLMSGKYADWDTYRDRVAEQFEKDPNLMSQTEAMSLQGAAQAYDRAYRLAKLEEIEQAITEGRPITAYDPSQGAPAPTAQQQQQMLSQADLARLAKLQGQVQPGGNGRLATPDPNDDWLARMKQGLTGQSYSSTRSGS